MTPSPSSSPATDFAVALLDEFVSLGLRNVVLSPGSRSQALALAAAEFERAGLIDLRVRIDERVAGFLALGLAIESSTPSLVIATSGTAIANLHPAVLEAHHAGVPLIIASADRPEALRGIGSNQTTQQSGIFGAAIDRSWDVGAPTGEDGEADAAAAVARDAWAAAVSGTSGFAAPVHLNLAFTEPLSAPAVVPERAASTDAATTDAAVADATTAPDALVLHPEPGTVVVAGAGAGRIAESVARELGAPLLAEVSSGAHFGPNLVVTYRELLATEGFGDQIRRVIVFGHPTLSREVPALVQRSDVQAIVVRSPGADDYNPGHRVERFADAVRVTAHPTEPAPDAASVRRWVGRWVTTSRTALEPAPEELPVDLNNADFARRQLAIVREPVTRRMLVEAVWRSTWPHDRLVLGASRLIREADAVVPGKRIPVHANRGLAGIDGTIATGLGIALASQRSAEGETPTAATGGTTRVLLGDLAALHDSGALLFGVGETRPRIQVIVGNDNGGTIFSGLEVAATAPVDAMERVLLTAQSVDFEKLATAYGWEYTRVDSRGDLDQALTSSAGPALIEVTLAR